jgi:hypothetical protein
MAFENSTTASGQQQIIAPTPNWMALIAGILFCGLAIALAYIIWYKNQTIEVISNKINHEKSVPAVIRDTAQQNELQRELEAANVRYDMLKMLDVQKDTANNLMDSDIQDKKARITELLSKVTLTQAELTEAKNLIASLKTNLDGYKVQTQKLADDKVSLMQEKDDVVKQRDKVQAQVDSATKVMAKKKKHL